MLLQYRDNVFPNRTGTVVSESSTQSDLLPVGPSTSSSNGRQPRNTVNPPTEDNASPTMLRFYPDDWKMVLKKAKNIYRYWLVSENAYPTKDAGQNEANEGIQEAIAQFKLEGGVLNQGVFSIIKMDMY
jgi:hypothetical protein